MRIPRIQACQAGAHRQYLTALPFTLCFVGAGPCEVRLLVLVLRVGVTHFDFAAEATERRIESGADSRSGVLLSAAAFAVDRPRIGRSSPIRIVKTNLPRHRR